MENRYHQTAIRWQTRAAMDAALSRFFRDKGHFEIAKVYQDAACAEYRAARELLFYTHD